MSGHVEKIQLDGRASSRAVHPYTLARPPWPAGHATLLHISIRPCFLRASLPVGGPSGAALQFTPMAHVSRGPVASVLEQISQGSLLCGGQPSAVPDQVVLHSRPAIFDVIPIEGVGRLGRDGIGPAHVPALVERVLPAARDQAVRQAGLQEPSAGLVRSDAQNVGQFADGEAVSRNKAACPTVISRHAIYGNTDFKQSWGAQPGGSKGRQTVSSVIGTSGVGDAVRVGQCG